MHIQPSAGLANGKSPIARAENTQPAVDTAPVDPMQLMQTLLPMLSQGNVTTIVASPSNLQVGSILGSPVFMKR